MYAIIETGGKQHKVEVGDILHIEKLDVQENETVTFDRVIAFHNDKKLSVGAPYVKNATVTATVVKNGKAKKITVFTYKPKKNQKRKMGHRQPYTRIQITEMGVAKATRAKKEAAETILTEAAQNTGE